MAITESRSLPPKFVEDLGKDYATQLTGLTSSKIRHNKISTNRLLVKMQAQTDAYTMATTQGQGIGAYTAYLQNAGAFQQGIGSFAGMPYLHDRLDKIIQTQHKINQEYLKLK